MNFNTEKDLRKAVHKQPVKLKKASSNVSSLKSLKDQDSSSDIVTQARLQRNQREANRNALSASCTIQRWWRGRSKAYKAVQIIEESLRNKLADIEKVTTALLSAGVCFVPPPAVSEALLKSIVFHLKYNTRFTKYKDIVMLFGFCKFALLPSLSQLEPSKNIIIIAMDFERSLLLIDFFICCLSYLKYSNMKPYSAFRLIITRTLLELVGGGTPYKMRYSKDLTNSFESLQSKLKQTSSYSFYRSTKHVSYDYLLSRDIFSAIKEVLISFSLILQKNTINEYGGNNSVSSMLGGSKVPEELNNCDFCITYGTMNEFDILFVTLLHLLVNLESEFFHIMQLMTVPMLTLALSQSFMQCTFFSIATNHSHILSPTQTMFRKVMDCLIDVKSASVTYNALSCGSHPNIRNHHWMLGNILSFSRDIFYSGNNTDSNTIISDSDLNIYLNTCTNWLLEYAVIEILIGRKGIIWSKNGQNLTAVALPDCLEHQILSLFSPPFLKALSDRILSQVSLPSSGWDSYISGKDVEEVQQALSTNAYVMTTAALKTVEQENTWFTSSWAKKITSSLVNTLKAPLSSALKSNTKNVVSKADNGSDREGALGSLCQLWSLLLTQASMAAMDSVPRKALIMLAFTGNTIEKLWISFLNSCNLDSEDFARANSLDSLFPLPDPKSGVQDSFAILVCFIALFRAHLLALNDEELYESGVRLSIMNN